MAVVMHEGRQIQRRQHTVLTTLCGRSSDRVADGMNIAPRQEEVTCKFCLRKLRALSKAPAKAIQADPAENIDLNKLVDFNRDPFGSRWVVGPGDKRQGLRGRILGTIGLRHASGYEVVLQLDDGRVDTFAPASLCPEQVKGVA